MADKKKGRVLHITPLQTFKSKNGNTYERREVVITVIRFDPDTGEPAVQEGNTPKFTFIGSRCKDLDGVKPGDEITVWYDIEGRSFQKEDGTTEYTADVRPFRAEKSGGETRGTERAVMPRPWSESREEAVSVTDPRAPKGEPDGETVDDLPF